MFGATNYGFTQGWIFVYVMLTFEVLSQLKREEIPVLPLINIYVQVFIYWRKKSFNPVLIIWMVN